MRLLKPNINLPLESEYIQMIFRYFLKLVYKILSLLGVSYPYIAKKKQEKNYNQSNI